MSQDARVAECESVARVLAVLEEERGKLRASPVALVWADLSAALNDYGAGLRE